MRETLVSEMGAAFLLRKGAIHDLSINTDDSDEIVPERVFVFRLFRFLFWDIVS